MFFVNRNVDSFGFVCIAVLFSVALCSGLVDSTLTGAENGAFDDGRSALQYQYGNYLSGLKRAAGFVGMRGKKAYDSNELDASEELNDELAADIQPFYFGPRETRAGFVGMRGKKADENTVYDKRAGFVGMRGKKASDYYPFWFLPRQESHLISEAIEPSKARRASSGFVGMRGR